MVKQYENHLLKRIKNQNITKKIQKTILYSRIRQLFPMRKPFYVDDRDQLDNAEIVRIDWKVSVKKPRVGIVQDYDQYPKWTKYRRFLENNSFDYDIYPIHCHDWIEQAKRFDIIVGLPSNSIYDLCECRCKYEILETYMGKICYPSSAHTRLYEDKSLEAYISKVTSIPFANTYISNDKDDALTLIKNLKFPVVSKIIPSSGSVGVEMVRNVKQARRIVNHAFSMSGRKTHLSYYQQKDFIYYQEFIPNDGYDHRVVVVGDWVFGFDRKVLPHDFRASGMGIEEKKELSEESMRIALQVNKIIQSPILAVDMVHGLDGSYYIIEFSPLCQTNSSEELQVNGTPGVYKYEADGSFHFEEGRYWLAELALRQLLLRNYFSNAII